MTHNEMVHGLCTQETITVQDFAELIRFTLDANKEVFYDGWINVYVPIWFDADKAFGLGLNSEENADWINMYIRQACMGHAMLLTFTTSTTIWMMVTALWWTILSTMMLSTHSMSMTLSTRRFKHAAP